MRHGGGGGAGNAAENVTTQVGATTAIIPIVAAWMLIFMPMRWPAAFRRVLLYALVIAPIVTLGGAGWLTSTWGLALVLFAGWHISSKYMTHTHYKPSPRKIAEKERQVSALTEYDHLRHVTTWNNKLRERK